MANDRHCSASGVGSVIVFDGVMSSAVMMYIPLTMRNDKSTFSFWIQTRKILPIVKWIYPFRRVKNRS